MTRISAITNALKQVSSQIALFASVGLFAIPAAAQPAAAPQVDEVVVTGSRIASSAGGVNPVTAVTSDQLEKFSPESLPAGLAKLPVNQPTKSSNTASDGGYQPTGNYLNLLGLDKERTLVLQDGRRVAPTYYDGTFDINTLPQLLTQRVEVVTGGASAVYGSDAVAGVVNFILDKEFVGLKGQVQGGMSTLGDARSVRIGVANGFNVLDRGHFEWSAEYFNRAPIMATGRVYATTSASLVGNGSVSQPLMQLTGTRLNGSSFGGLITTGPLAGQQFLENGILAPFDKGAVINNSGVSIGGDGSWRRDKNLLPSLQTGQAFGRFDYEFPNGTKAYVQANYAQTNTISRQTNIISTQGSVNALTIYSGNAFLRPEYQNILTATNTASFNLSRYNEDWGNLTQLHNMTSAISMTAGLQGRVFGNFDWEAYYTHGVGRTSQRTIYNFDAQKLSAALDAVRDPSSGEIVCRVTLTAPGTYPGCVPVNMFGPTAVTQKALDYFSADTSWSGMNILDDFGASITGTILEGWAGPIQASLGAEYRLRSLNVTTTVEDNSFDKRYLRVGLNGNTVPLNMTRWMKNITGPSHGADSVYEGDLELRIPLLKDVPLAQSLSMSLAGRYTHYSISGAALPWRLGMMWTPFDEVKVRSTLSEDIRAPSLFDLYQGTTSTASGFRDPLTNYTGTILNTSQGNPNLVPEVAKNTTAGITYQPSWMPNFTAYLDYFHVAIANGITQVSGTSTTAVKLCVESGGTSPLCALAPRPNPITDTSQANAPTISYNLKMNAARTYTEGVVLGLDYAADLADYASSLSGIVNANLQWTHQPTLKTQSLPGTTILNTAGTPLAPTDRINFTFGYALDAFSTSVTLRYFSPFHYSPDPTLIVGQPPSTPYLQTDLDFSYDFNFEGEGLTAFVNVNNLFDAHGGMYQTSTANPGLLYPAPPFVDQIGRYVTVGLRLRAN